jgi:hypothetical protein
MRKSLTLFFKVKSLRLSGQRSKRNGNGRLINWISLLNEVVEECVLLLFLWFLGNQFLFVTKKSQFCGSFCNVDAKKTLQRNTKSIERNSLVKMLSSTRVAWEKSQRIFCTVFKFNNDKNTKNRYGLIFEFLCYCWLLCLCDKQKLLKAPLERIHADQIDKDINRTMRGHIKYSTRFGKG